jgi:hypothetical protein
MTFPFTYEAEFTNGFIDISIDYLNEKWNLFITGDISGIYFSYSNINLLNNQLTLDIIRNITYEIIKSKNRISEYLWYIQSCLEYEKKNINEFDLAKNSVTSNIITSQYYSHNHFRNDYDKLIKEYPHIINVINKI